MRKFYILFILIFITLVASAQRPLWRVGTALTLPQGWFDKGVFQPLRYGLLKKTELSTYPLLNIYAPNIAVKQRWYTTENQWFFSTKHGIYHPTRALRKLSGNENYHVLPDTAKVPFLLPSYHEVLASKFLKSKTSCTLPDLLLTLKLGVKFSIGSAEEVDMPPIEDPFVYHPTQPYYGKFMWYTGADLEGNFTEFINYSVDINFENINWFDSWNVSHKGLLVIPWTDRWTLAAGYTMQYGDFPGEKKFTVLPMLDVSYKFTFRRKRSMQHGLFQRMEFKYDDFQEKDDPIETDPYHEFYPEEEKYKKKKEEKEEEKKK